MIDYEIDFVKVFIPKLSYLSDIYIENFINSKYYFLRKNNIMVSRIHFKNGYPNFNLNIYYIFNDDIKDLNELKIKYHWHTFLGERKIEFLTSKIFLNYMKITIIIFFTNVIWI